MTDVSKPGMQASELVLHGKSKVLEVAFASGARFRLPFEMLRVFSPSAEVVGHGPGQEVLQIGKKDIGIKSLEPVGRYGVKPVFSDGHDTGIFSWDYLFWLGENQERLWQDYEKRLLAAGASREPVAEKAMRTIPIRRV